ncbi:GDSL-type esterase/lipase family protein [Hydrogenoanaerobacterium sp.]|uniref:GDSL-type esterase/lipase family protein n=1 Tax=Hydrogenoanaerobacterium sp. TaxID=2953763 RepID=UPI00289EFF70|nr:GDSL-type esterase/lipase family protein [Hydrogenoanaerobacterium sp.]
MAKKREVFVNRDRKKPSAVTAALVIVVISALIAFTGAYAWQTLSGDQAKLEAKQSNQPSSSSSSAVSSSSQPSSTEEIASSKPEETSSEPESVPELDSSVMVPESERVNSSYFDDAMFVGDSITNGILSYQIMQNTTVISHTGINPDTIRYKKVYRDSSGELVTILDAMKAYPDKEKIYIMLGSNGLAWIEQELFIEYYEEFLRDVMAQHPNATIYIQSILPVTKAKSDSDAAYANSKIDKYNADILALTEKLGLHYLNVAEAFKDANGALPNEASPNDGMHFTSKYYQVWFDYLKTHTVQG